MSKITNTQLREAHEQAQRADLANRLNMKEAQSLRQAQERLEREFRTQAPEVASRGAWAALGA